MSLEELVGQSIENKTKIVMTNVESNEFTPIDNDLQFKIPPAEVGLLTKPTNKAQTGIGLTKAVLHPTTCLVDTVEGAESIKEHYLKPQKKC